MNEPLTLLKSPRDERDWHYGKIVCGGGELPERVSLRQSCGPIRRQGKSGFCHSFAGTALKNLQETLDWGERRYNFSPLGLARAVKARDGIAYTEGSTLLDVCKALCNDGVFDEVFYPFTSYDQESFKKTGKLHFPSMAVTAEEEEHIPKYYCKNYARVDTLEEVKLSLANQNPVLLGMTCSEEIYSPTEGCIGLPLGTFLIGGHAVLIIGYDDTKERTIHGRHYKGFLECQNSWGEDWGDKGFFWIPYEYITYRTKDFGMGFVMDMYTAIDLARENLQGTAVELFIGKDKAFDDGKEITLDQPPIVDEKTGRTLVPLRFVGESLGCRVEWLAKSRRIIIRSRAHDIELSIGNQTALVDGGKRLMEQAPILDERTGRTLVPLRFIAETLGHAVLWDGERRKIIILK